MLIIPRWSVAMLMYAIIILLLIAFKPAIMFDAEGDVKRPGTGLMYGSSPFSPVISFPIIAVLCYVLACLFNLALV